MGDLEKPPLATHTRDLEPPISTQALLITLQWLRQIFNQQIGVATWCMHHHVVIIQGTTALLALVELWTRR